MLKYFLKQVRIYRKIASEVQTLPIALLRLEVTMGVICTLSGDLTKVL